MIYQMKELKKEINTLLYASEDLKCDNLLVITDEYESEENVKWFGESGRIKFIPLWKWLPNC